MAWDTGLDAAMEQLFDQKVGRDGVFTPASGPTVEVKCYVEKPLDGGQPDALESLTWQRITTIECRLLELGRSPERGETFTVDGSVYEVQGVEDYDDRFVKSRVVVQ